MDRTSQFVNEANRIHNYYYDYSKSVYKNARVKVKIICKQHGLFLQLPRKHLRGQGCPPCGRMAVNYNRKLDSTEFVRRSIAKHGNLYDYSNSQYVDSLTKISIICPTHGEFKQLPASHWCGRGCPKCNIQRHSIFSNLTSDGFISIARKLYNDKYSYQVYDNQITNRSIVIVDCAIHGQFTTRAGRFLRGFGCKKCGHQSAKRKTDSEVHHQRAVELYGNKFDFSATDFSKSTINILCKKHGVLIKNRSSFLAGDGCTQCGLEKLSSLNRLPVSEFIRRANLIHNNRYVYVELDYTNNCCYIPISCVTHGIFYQSVKHHLRGQGCPKCSVSSGQLAIYNFIRSVYGGEVVLNDRSVLSPYEVDVYLPDLRLGVEYHGLYYHSYASPETTQQRCRHRDKAILALGNIRLVQILESEWLQKEQLVKSFIVNKLGISAKVFARKCAVVKLDNKQWRNCVDGWHLSSYKHADVKLGLIYDGDLVMIIGFSHHAVFQWEIARMASKCGCVVVGGASKLLAHFIANYSPTSIMTFADARYSCGDCYRQLGFKFLQHTKPNYFYVNGSSIHSRIKFQKHKLPVMLESFDGNLTESGNMFANGYRRLWDAGHFQFLWEHNKSC